MPSTSSLFIIEDAKFSFEDFFTLVSRLKTLSKSERNDLSNKSLGMIVSVDGKKSILSVRGGDISGMYIRNVLTKIAYGLDSKESKVIKKFERYFKVKRRIAFKKAELLPCGSKDSILGPVPLGSGLISSSRDGKSGFVYLFEGN